MNLKKEKLKRILNNYEYISFDMFDTLLFRSVAEPSDIWRITQDIHNGSSTTKIEDFVEKRLNAEVFARNSHKNRDINIDEIYNNLDYNEDTLNLLKNLEKFVEINNCVPNECMIEILNMLYDQNKYIIISSDMYLDASTVKSILSKLNVRFHRLYLSSDIGPMKVDGAMYKYILKDLNIEPSKLIHVGDNIISDIEMPKKYGIRSCMRIQDKITPLRYFKKINNDINDIHLKKIIEYSQNSAEVGDMEKFGFSVLGPFLIGFCQWVHINVTNKRIKRLFFVSREGYLLKRCYDFLYPEEKDKTCYLHMNKNLLRLPILHVNRSVNTFLKTITHICEYSLDEVLKYFDFDRTEYENLKNKISNKFGTIVSLKWDDMQSGAFDELFEMIFDAAADRMLYQYTLLLAYLQEKNFFCGNIGLVNNSFNGNGQLMIESILSDDETVKIYGLQFIKNKKSSIKSNERIMSWFDCEEISDYNQYIFQRQFLMFEHFLFPEEGTAIRYELNCDNIVKAILEKDEAEKDNTNLRNKIQIGVMQFFKEYKNHVPLKVTNIVIYNYLDFITNPLKSEAKQICEFVDQDNGNIKKITDLNYQVSTTRLIREEFIPNILWKQGYVTANDFHIFFVYLINCYDKLKNKKRNLEHILKL